MEKVIHKLINEFTEGVDTYTHNGSTWLIFTESKQWVIELTDSKTLWYNYNFFKSAFSYTSMDVVDNQQYITKWVEDNIINGVKDTILEINITEGEIDDIIQDGVKLTQFNDNENKSWVEGVIKNGVKETIELMNELPNKVKKIIKKGVKHTQERIVIKKSIVDDAIEKGVRHTLNTEYMPMSMVEDIIQNGVKETNHVDVMKFFNNKMEDALENGVKETKTPGKDGDILSTIEWMKENKSTSYTKMIDDVIDNGEKINGTYVGGNRQKENIESVIGYGTKNPSV